MSRAAASWGLASSCLSLRHVRLLATRVRVHAKPSITYARSSTSYTFGPSLQRGRRLSRPFEPVPSEKSQSRQPQELSDDRNAFLETNLLNARELADKLVKEDGSVKRFVKGAELDRESFTRVFDLVALRVPADECGLYVSRLKGHLLNWPRVKNVPRVEGDDGDVAIKSLLWEDNGTHSLIESVRSAVYPDESDTEETMVKKQKGKLPNLRKLTRGLDSDLIQSMKTGRGGSSKNPWEEGAVTVEVVDDDHKLSDYDNEPREATRLLLLDESYRDKCNDELPQAVQMVLGNAGCELILKEVLPSGMTIPSAFESVGHIAHLNLRDEHTPYRHVIAQIVLEKNKPRIRTVVNKTDVIHNKYRTMQLELLAGNSSLVTTVVEHGFSFRLDLASVYWNSRLATERQRLVDTFNKHDIVCDMFAGVGPIAVVAAKKVKFVYANDLNPTATAYMQQNLSTNKLAYKAEVSNEDARQFVRNLLARERPVLFSQVVMNLPLDAAEFLDVFVHAFSRDVWEQQTLPQIHVYGFSKAKNPEAEYSERIADILNEMPHPMHIHRVRLVAPGKYMLCASFRLPASVAFPTQGQA